MNTVVNVQDFPLTPLAKSLNKNVATSLIFFSVTALRSVERSSMLCIHSEKPPTPFTGTVHATPVENLI